MKDKIRLKSQLSLDLLDNSKLTSLPFPPPLKKTKPRFKKFAHWPGHHHHHSTLPSSPQKYQSGFTSFGMGHSPQSSVQLDSSPRSSVGVPTSDFNPNLPKLPQDIPMEDVSFTSIDTLTEMQNMTTEIDESFEDEPIILVEDYLKPPVPQQPTINRQQSLATFKQKLNQHTLSTINSNYSSPGANNKRKISNDTVTEPENLEEIFGELPGKQLLKYCDICDKPLYEISSIISNKRLKKTPNDHKKIDINLFNEFICFECIELYEEFLQELYHHETTSSATTRFNELKNLKLLKIFKTVQLRSDVSNNQLIKKLKFLNSNVLIHDELNWIKSLQNKLRWRWRINGLLPNFRKKDVNT